MNRPTICIGSIILCMTLSGCASNRLKRLSGSEFVDRAERMKQVSSFDWTTYIGSTQQRAYLEYGRVRFLFPGSRTTVYWTPLSELPPGIADQLQTGKPPWKPWWTETKR